MSGTNYNKNSSVPYIANLLTSILIHNPEITKIKLDPRKQVVKISFYVKNISHKIKLLKEYLRQSLETYYYLTNVKAAVSLFDFQQLEYFTIMELQRDIISFSEKEISLIIALLKEDFDATLVIDDNGLLLMDNPTLHEELVSYLLDNTKTGIELVALRDEGRVVVFNN